MKEITETYFFHPGDFNAGGAKEGDATSFRDVVKQWERNFHELHPSDYALNLYANRSTMCLLQKSCGAADYLSYGMELTCGSQFHPKEDAEANRQIDHFSKKMIVYGIDSAFMVQTEDSYGIDEETGIYPLTLLIDDTMSNGVLKLSKPTDDGSEEGPEDVYAGTPKKRYAYV